MIAATRLMWVILLALVGVWGAGCAAAGVGFVPSPNRAADLPGGTAALVALSDRLVASESTSARALDRALAALESAREEPDADAFQLDWREARAAVTLARALAPADRPPFLSRARRAAGAAMKLQPDRVEGAYYLAFAIALEAEISQDVELIAPMRSAAEAAVKADPAFEDASPLRLLGKIYLEAPEWPTSIGDKERAVELLERAVELAPTAFNQFFLGEALYHDEQPERAREVFSAALAISGEGALASSWRNLAREYLEELGELP